MMTANKTFLAAIFLLGACAQSPEDIAPAYTSEMQFKDWSCEQLAEEQGRLVMALTTASAQQQEARSNDIAGVILLGLPVASLSGSNIASQVARLKGERDAIERALTMNDCAAAVKAEAPVSVAATREGDEDLRNVTSVVPAMSEQWVASGVEADKGQTYSVSASGSWTANSIRCGWSGPDGGSGPCSAPLEYPQDVAASYSALIAKIGNGPAFLVGGAVEFTADRSGVLYFRMNDAQRGFDNNEGAVTVQTAHIVAAPKFTSEPADWQRMSGEPFKMLFDNKTHKTRNASMYYDGYGERIIRWEGEDYPAYYYLRDDEYVYSSKGTHKSAEIWTDPSADNRYQICQKGVCWEMKLFDGNIDNLK